VSLEGKRVYIGAGENDQIVSRLHPQRLAEMLRVLGADVTLIWQPAAHALTRPDVASAYDWLEASKKVA